MRFLSSFLVAAAAASTLAVAAPADARPVQGVIVVDYSRIIRESDVGRDMQQKLDAIRQQMIGELGPAQQQFQQEGQRFQAATSGLTAAQQRNPPPAIQEQYSTLRQHEAMLSRAADLQQANMNATIDAAQSDLMTQIEPYVRQVADQRRAGIVLSSVTTGYFSPENDATADVIARLNQNLRTINVTRRSVQTQPAAAAAPAAAPGVAAPAPAPATPPRQ